MYTIYVYYNKTLLIKINNSFRNYKNIYRLNENIIMEIFTIFLYCFSFKIEK